MDTVNLTTNQAAGLGAIAGGVLGVFGVFTIALIILMIVAMWRIFTKAGEKGWKSLIPIYNIYILFKISGATGWFWGYLLVTIGVTIFNSVMISMGQATTVDGQIQFNNSAFGIVTLCASIFEIVVYVMLCHKLSRAFGRGAGTTIGLIFLPNIFQLILAFGSAKYNKKAIKK